MASWMNLGQMLKMNAVKYPDTICLMDDERSYTYPETNERVCRLANSLLALGLAMGDRVSVLLENCIEFVELYLAAAKAGLVLNPINFRLSGADVKYISNHAEAKAFVVHDMFADAVEDVRKELNVPADRYVMVGGRRAGYLGYEDLVAGGQAHEPDSDVLPRDPWILLYTSGTTGRPKGVVRSHESYVAFYLINAVDFDFRPGQRVLNVMPLCHVNTTFFTFTFTYIGGTTYVVPAMGFDPRKMLETVERAKINFISLIPTHYALILAVPPAERAKFDVSSINKLLCSSAPARIEHKKGIMEYFEGVQLYEGYGSTEAGIVTTLMPHEQLTKPGSIGKESLGTDSIRILDEDKRDVPPGEIGELYSRGPMMFDGYFRDPEKTAESFTGEWFSAGDMAYRDEDGYYFLVDRKNNMIITGGEHVFPSEVENVICRHQAVFDVAVIGLPDQKWGEAVRAVVILKDGCNCAEDELVDLCRCELASYKRPKSVRFIKPDQMPRTSTGKILHRLLRERYGSEQEAKDK
ncbi:MAG TPA: AMP-binding protein [Myxococcota bacterium]|nr:AMP-binding protein [Myxococcota bacterium]